MSVARRTIKAIYLRFLFLTGLLKWARSRAAGRGVVVLTLHQVLRDEEYDSTRPEPGMALSASSFQSLLEYLARHCQCILPAEAWTAQAAPRQPRVVLTFDDGWKNNFETAFPISQKYGARFTVFICPEMITRRLGFWTATANRLWWTAQRAGKLDLLRAASPGNGSAQQWIASLKHVDSKEREVRIARLQAALQPYEKDGVASSSEQLLTWGEIKEMAAAGIAFGSHTNTHPILTDISPADATRELTESRRAIEAELNTCAWFAYPNGDWSQPVRELAAKAGYQLAFANSPGIWEASGDRFSIPRINVWEGSFAGITGRFSGIALEYAIFWKAWCACARV